MYQLNTFRAERHTNLTYSPETLQQLPCGLFRCPLDQAYRVAPTFNELYDSAPVSDPSEWELDLKIHMLMKNQYPALPNWHCDNVPRVDGVTQYGAIDDSSPRMLLWISGGPHTEFLTHDECIPEIPMGHSDLAGMIKMKGFDTMLIPGNTWISMDQRTPHRGTKSTGFSWRVFARLTHRSIAPARPVLSHIRRHAQVYLDPETFSW